MLSSSGNTDAQRTGDTDAYEYDSVLFFHIGVDAMLFRVRSEGELVLHDPDTPLDDSDNCEECVFRLPLRQLPTDCGIKDKSLFI